MIIYDGGSSRDEILNKYSIGNSNSFKVTSLRSQMFIVFTTDGHGVDKGFTAIISFGNKSNHEILIIFVHIILQWKICIQFEE